MPRKYIDAPSYRYHISGQAVVMFDGKNYYLGPHDSPESKARYYALLNEFHAKGMQMPEQRDTQPAVITVRVVTAGSVIATDEPIVSCASDFEGSAEHRGRPVITVLVNELQPQ